MDIWNSLSKMNMSFLHLWDCISRQGNYLWRDKFKTLEFSAMIFIRVEVRSNNHTVAELPASQGLLCLLAISNTVKLDKHLQRNIHSINIVYRLCQQKIKNFKGFILFHIQVLQLPLLVVVFLCCVHSHICCIPLWKEKGVELVTNSSFFDKFEKRKFILCSIRN